MKHIILAITFLLFLATPAAAQFTAQLCWTPVNDPSVAGYNLYVNDSELPFVAGIIDVGLPTTNAAGNMVYSTPIDPGTANTLTFRVAAYGGVGVDFWEGPKSNPLDINCLTAEAVLGRQVCATCPTCPTCPMRGDVDCDGQFTINDVLFALRAVVSPTPLPECVAP